MQKRPTDDHSQLAQAIVDVATSEKPDLDTLEVKLRSLGRSVTRHESKQLRGLLDEVKAALAGGGKPEELHVWLKGRLSY